MLRGIQSSFKVWSILLIWNTNVYLRIPTCTPGYWRTLMCTQVHPSVVYNTLPIHLYTTYGACILQFSFAKHAIYKKNVENWVASARSKPEQNRIIGKNDPKKAGFEEGGSFMTFIQVYDHLPVTTKRAEPNPFDLLIYQPGAKILPSSPALLGGSFDHWWKFLRICCILPSLTSP